MTVAKLLAHRRPPWQLTSDLNTWVPGLSVKTRRPPEVAILTSWVSCLPASMALSPLDISGGCQTPRVVVSMLAPTRGVGMGWGLGLGVVKPIEMRAMRGT